MRKWILFAILGIGILFVAAGCTPTKAGTSNCSPTNIDGAETVTIAGATFKMGSLAANPGAKADEQPQHDVTLGCYNIYKNEVTNSMYNKCVATGACVPVQARVGNPTAHINDPAFADYPVTGADYNMASEYCTWAGGRLPTEAEWEYAARGSNDLAYPWGNTDPTCSLANSKGCLIPEDTEKVGSLTAGDSPFKINNMAGNAWEWVFDWYAADAYGKSTATDPIGPVAGFWKVVRGGGYNSIPAFLRSANRLSGDPYKPYYNVGFRCVADKPLTLPDTYTPPNPDQHQIAIDGPVDDDDPGGTGKQIQWSISPANCPDGNGNIHFALSLLPHSDVTLTSFTVDGNDFTCTWDDGSQTYQCVGPNSANANPNYDVKFCAHSDTYGDGCMAGLQIPKPQNCDKGQYPQELTYSLGCPQGGFIKVSFHSDPAVTWDTTEIDGGIAMSCIGAGADLTCMAQDVPPGGPYVFHLKGKDAGNVPYEAWINANPNPNCPQGNKDFKGSLITYCNTINTPMTSMNFITDLPGDPILKVGGTDVILHVVTPGWAAGLLDPSLQGLTVPYAMGIDPDMLSFGTVAVPDCKKGGQGYFTVDSTCDQTKGPVLIITIIPGNIPPLTFTINGVAVPWVPDTPGGDTMTYPVPLSEWGTMVTVEMTFPQSSVMHKIYVPDNCFPGGDKQLSVSPDCEKGSPVAIIGFWPPIHILEAVKFNGEPDSLAACTQVDPTQYSCPLNPAWEGTSVSAEIQLSGDWMTKTFTESICNQSPSCSCRLLGVDCISTDLIGFSVQTCAQNPTPLVSQSVTATDGEVNYQCQIQNQVGQVYCAGPRPSNPGPLTVCYVAQGSQDQICCTLTDFANVESPCTNYHPHPSNCSAYTDANSCKAAGCTPVVDPKSGAFTSCQ